MKKLLIALLIGVYMPVPLLFAASPTPPTEPGVALPSLGNHHVRSLDEPHIPYNSKPPTSGPHLPNIASWGVYDQPIPNELQVHNLEDGGVMIQYDCKNCADLIGKLERLAEEYYQRAATEKLKSKGSRWEHLIVAPYPRMGTGIALTAWTRIDRLETYDEARIRRFIEAYIGIDHHPRDGKK